MPRRGCPRHTHPCHTPLVIILAVLICMGSHKTVVFGVIPGGCTTGPNTESSTTRTWKNHYKKDIFREGPFTCVPPGGSVQNVKQPRVFGRLCFPVGPGPAKFFWTPGEISSRFSSCNTFSIELPQDIALPVG